ncbi:MAG: hypothetical protein A2189_00765 [Paenibacillus sp. RIFOXYA1_FULL_44_5]|nr:MAG: hypothetical protein A2189_00765 [Paenibacillus sp. RIFOXYA1_FULL_44_5]
MFKNKWVSMLIVSLIAITLVVATAFILSYFLLNKKFQPLNSHTQSPTTATSKQLTAAEIKDLTVPIDDILTNLSNKAIIKISLSFELDSKKSKDEFALRDAQVRDIILRTLADTNPDQIKGSKGYDYLCTTLINKINNIMTSGKLLKINVTNIILN